MMKCAGPDMSLSRSLTAVSAALILAVVAGCSSPASVPSVSAQSPPTDPLRQMEAAFLGSPSRETIQPLLDAALRATGTPVNADSYSRSGSVLVALRKQNGASELAVLRCVPSRADDPRADGTFPQVAAVCSVGIAMGQINPGSPSSDRPDLNTLGPDEDDESTEPEMTAAQEQAVGLAEDYLANSHFSKSGLVKQLKYEGFSTKNATFAVEHIDVSWKKQAAGKAKEYLESSHFSRSGLIEQLRYEGFTQLQAEYGVKKAGL